MKFYNLISNKQNIFFISCSLAFVFLFQNCSPSLHSSASTATAVDNNEPFKERPQTSVVFPAYTLRQLNFGYYGVNGWGQNYFNEVKNFSNTVWIAPELGDPLLAKETIKALDAIYLDLNHRAILDVEKIFFDDRLRLRPDAAERWDVYVTKIKPYFYKILSIYPLDEPYGWGAGVGLSYKEMQDQMEKVADIIKKTGFANIPLSISFTTRTTHLPIPKGYDWVGVDCYGSWDFCDGKSIIEHNNILKQKLQPQQKIILFADAGLRDKDMKFNEEDQKNLLSRFANYIEYAKAEPQVIGVFAFIWQSFPSQSIIGARDLPLFKKGMVELSKDYLQTKPSPQPPMICAGGKTDVSSNDLKNDCHFEWGPTLSGRDLSTAAKTMLSTNGGMATATCRSDGLYDFTWSCPNEKNTPTVCAAGYAKKEAVDKSNSCEFSWSLGNDGSDLVTTLSTNGGILSGKCLSDGSWNFSYSCPGKTPSCAGGSLEIPSTSEPANKNKNCRFAWEPTLGGQAAVNLRDLYNRGNATGFICHADGKSWKQGSFLCP